ncbi:MAG: RrF2 family transcriptional regulator [Actinomycetota bacterium]
MLVTREADYAIRCVLEVARQGRVSAARVAELQGISPTFLGKIVQSLARAGILSTRRGVGGGVTLAVPLEEITLLRVIEAVEGPLCLNDCVADPPQCPQIDTCPVYPYLDRAQGALRALLTVNLAELAKDGPLPLGDFPALNAKVPGNGKGTAPVPAIGGEA